MIGIIPKVLTDLVVEQADKATLKTIFKQANLPANTEYNINKPYSDEDWNTLFDTTLLVLKIDKEIAFMLYADQFINYVSQLFPSWFEMADNSKDFLKLQPVIHNSFASGLINPEKRKTVNDKFKLTEEGQDLIVTYQSKNKLCELYIALAKRVATYYQDNIDISESSCLLKGDPYCELRIHWTDLSKQHGK